MFNDYDFWGSKVPQGMSTDSSYTTSGISSSSSSHSSTPGGSTSGMFGIANLTDRFNTLSTVTPIETAGIISILKNRNVDELRKLLSDNDAYQSLLLSLEPIITQNRVRDELRNKALQHAKENLEKEPRIMELRNQCRIIQNMELATAQEKLYELERKKVKLLEYYSPSALHHRLQDAMNKIEEESETLHGELVDRKIELPSFVLKYKKMRYKYHKHALTHLATKSSMTG